jgi:uncharacterized membrane protein
MNAKQYCHVHTLHQNGNGNVALISIPLDDTCFVTSLQDTFVISSAQLSNHCYKVIPEELAQHWNIGLGTAKCTLRVTTQSGVKNIVNCALV